MKKIHIITGLFILATALSCKKDFLERPPLNQLSESTFWKTENDVYLAVNGVYNQLPGDGIIYDDAAADNAFAQYSWESTATDVSAGTMKATLDAGWNFVTIGRANYFLANADKVTVIGKPLLDRYKAEVRFIRAYQYLWMVNKFGDVPLLTAPVELGKERVPRTPKAEVLKYVLDELNAISTILPPSYAGGKPNEKGRITKGAVLALKTRLLLTEASPLFNTSNDLNKWKLAAESAQEVMGMGYDLFKVNTEKAREATDDYTPWVNFADQADQTKFRLALRSYEGLFHQANEGNVEVILDKQQIPIQDANYWNTYLPTADLSGWASIVPTQELVSSYESYKTGEPIAPVDPAQRATLYATNNVAFANEFKNRDPRFYATILFPGAPWNAMVKEDGYKFVWTEGTSNYSKTGYAFRKLVDSEIFREQSIDNSANVILIRYAEILLSYAEAKNEWTGPDATIFDALDKIRTRAGMPLVDRVKYGTQPALREFIRNERRVELALEGQRYMDIRRWKIAPQVMKSINDLKTNEVQKRVWTDKLYLMPIPQAQIDLSKNVLSQNKDY